MPGASGGREMDAGTVTANATVEVPALIPARSTGPFGLAHPSVRLESRLPDLPESVDDGIGNSVVRELLFGSGAD